ncbi:MAG: DEAD/DEAH box helicase family protein, partial [Desulfobulbus sp.]|nr:DEAD/DEAH box helicase family protein [Desulfobulbus sp.]
CLKMATGTGKTWVLQALMIWQLLNKTALLAEGLDDDRFTRHFLVVAPGLIVYDRLLDALRGKLKNGLRDFSTSDVARFAELFIPEPYRKLVFGFVQGNVCEKQEIGLKATGNGLIAIANWHVLAGEDEEGAEPEDEMTAPASGEALADPQAVIADLLPLSPGKSAGNALDMLDKRYARGGVLDYLAGLPSLMAFNDEAHHIHEVKAGGEASEVEWQKSLSRIAASKGRRFVQVDFSATPYNDVGGGKNKSPHARKDGSLPPEGAAFALGLPGGKRRKVFFPHIIVDFDLKRAMRAGLVKSLVLDRRKELGALPLEFKAERDADGNPMLGEGQRVMLRAGLHKLKKLEADFATIDPNRHPKMLVVCEDTSVSPLVVQFLRDEGLGDDEVMSIDSGKKAELGEKDWAAVRERLFDVDRHATPRVIVSVLMLREGFDVNNICVIVPLRASQAQILLEQTIGRGLRLMWRDEEYDDSKRENRERIDAGQEPSSLIDILSIIEHPAFQSFYDELMEEGLAGVSTEESDATGGAGDLIRVGLREGFEAFDFALPFILREAEEYVEHGAPPLESLPPFTKLGRDELAAMLGKGDTFVSQDLQSATLFGDYRVAGAVMNVGGYNDYLARLTRRIGQALSSPLPKTGKIATHHATPYMQMNTAELTGWIDAYIRQRLFAAPFDPLDDENWRLLLLGPVVDHITQVFALALIENEQKPIEGEIEVRHRRLSEVDGLTLRESHSLPVAKCIYERLPFPAKNGGLERAFIEWAQSDASVAAFCKISETRHDFARLRYVKEDGLPAFYSPDFLVRAEAAVYLVETKAQQQTTHPNVQRKLKAAHAWCERINTLPAAMRDDCCWRYALVGEALFYEWRGKGARLPELLDFARVRPQLGNQAQGKLDFT